MYCRLQPYAIIFPFSTSNLLIVDFLFIISLTIFFLYFAQFLFPFILNKLIVYIWEQKYFSFSSTFEKSTNFIIYDQCYASRPF
jgi:hypothetical protein